MRFANFHIVRALGYALKGLRAVWQTEVAFRQEVFASIVIVPLGLFLGATSVEKVLLVGSWLMVLVVELINSSLETIVDLAQPEQHPLAGRAKDIGSAAVLISILLVAFVWAILLL